VAWAEVEGLPPKPKVRLLQSPWEAAQAAKERRMTSVTRWDCGREGGGLVWGSSWGDEGLWGGRKGSGGELTVRTLPPTTAALSEGERNEFSGMRTSMGLRQPWLRGMPSEMRQRRQ